LVKAGKGNIAGPKGGKAKNTQKGAKSIYRIWDTCGETKSKASRYGNWKKYAGPIFFVKRVTKNWKKTKRCPTWRRLLLTGGARDFRPERTDFFAAGKLCLGCPVKPDNDKKRSRAMTKRERQEVWPCLREALTSFTGRARSFAKTLRMTVSGGAGGFRLMALEGNIFQEGRGEEPLDGPGVFDFLEGEDGGGGEGEEVGVFGGEEEFGGEGGEEGEVSDDHEVVVEGFEFGFDGVGGIVGVQVGVLDNSFFGRQGRGEEEGGLFGAGFPAVPDGVNVQVQGFEEGGEFFHVPPAGLGKGPVRVVVGRFCFAVANEVESHDHVSFWFELYF
jgi:hypothetical protein